MNAVRDIPPRAAVAVLSLAFLATVVGGGERPLEPATPTPATKQAPDEKAQMEEPALDSLTRIRSGRERQDLFASHSWTPLPVAVPAPSPARPAITGAPSPPQLPFKYL